MASKLLFFMVDVETGGSQAPVMGEMTELGCVLVEPSLSNTFYWNFKNVPQDLRNDLGNYNAEIVWCKNGMFEFEKWIQTKCAEFDAHPVFISDNNGFDWQFVNHNFWNYLGRNPFGHSSQNLGSLYKGYVGSFTKNFKHLRVTRHTHDPVDDSRGNVEALMTFIKGIQGMTNLDCWKETK